MPIYPDLYQVSLKVLLKNSQGEILVLKNPLELVHVSGLGDFPGGRINTDELKVPLEEIIGREILEEIGNIKYKLRLSPVALGRRFLSKELNFSREPVSLMFLFFEADYLGGEITISPEHSGFQWLKLEEIQLGEYFNDDVVAALKKYLQNS